MRDGSDAMIAGRTRNALAALSLAGIYSVCFVAIKAGLAFAPPLLFAGLRAEIAGVALLGVLVFLRRPLIPARGTWLGLVALALCSTSLGFGAMFLIPGQTGAGIASVLGNLQPLFVLILAAAFLGEALTGAKVVALGIGLAGVTLIALPAIAGPDAYGVSGPVLAIGASVSLAVGNVVLKRIGGRQDLLTMTAWQLVLGGLPLLALAALVDGSVGMSWTATFAALLVGLALGGTALPYVVWNHLARHEDIGRLVLYLLLVPVFGVVLARLVFGERLGALEVAGLVAIVAAVGISSLGPAFSPVTQRFAAAPNACERKRSFGSTGRHATDRSLPSGSSRGWRSSSR
jgi:O-acetylserine/cysteine efflux transporter